MTSQSAMKRDLIINSAEKVFFKKGFYPATMEEIAQTAGIAKGTIYIYFKDKESVYLALIEKRLNEVIDFMESVAKENMKSSEKLKKLYKSFLDYTERAQNLQAFISIENIQVSINLIRKFKNKVIPKVKKLILVLSHIVESGIREGEIMKIEPLIGTLLFLSYLRLIILLPMFEKLYSFEFRTGKEEISKIILDAFFHGLCSQKIEDKERIERD